MNPRKERAERPPSSTSIVDPFDNAPALNVPNRRKAPPSSLSNGPRSGSTSPTLEAAPQTSRTVSPIRQLPKGSDSLTSPQSGSERKSRDASPSTASKPGPNSTSTPSVAAVQNALSSLNANPRQASGPPDASAGKSARTPNPGSTSSDAPPAQSMHWPISPRLKSPPPASRRSSLVSRPSDTDSDDVRITSIQEPSSLRHSQDSSANGDGGRGSIAGNLAPPKLPRGPSGLSSKLETVDEGEHSTSPVLANGSLPPIAPAPDKKLNEQQSQMLDHPRKDAMVTESGNESNGIKALETSRSAASAKIDESRQQVPKSKRSYSNLSPAKVRPGNDGLSKLMTVETETVSSIPQTAAGSASERGTGVRGDGSSLLRSRPSSEAMRPKREKKKSTRKPTSTVSSTAATKADIFEANVASAVDEADSEDSEETFVYESNPTDSRPRHLRHHSRTPSATSVTSLLDRKGGGRGLGDNRNVTGKKSMKFASNSYAGVNGEVEASESNPGTVRTSNNRSDTHSHIGLFGRNGRANSTQVSEESPFSQASKLRSTTELTPRQYSRPQTPKSGNAHYLRTPTRKADLSSYDYEGDGTDDERTPLVGTVRTHRPSRNRLPNGMAFAPNSTHHVYYETPRRSVLSRVAGCLVMAITLTLVILGAAGFLLATTKPLYDVSVQEIQNVLASEQEIMLDLLVHATNPNIVSVTIGDMDVNVFAKSKHVGTNRSWQAHHPFAQRQRRTNESHHKRRKRQPNAAPAMRPFDNVDHGTDPIPDDPDEEGDAQTMLLGQIFAFDSALSFEATPIHQYVQTSKGELRLSQPGNKTEAGGSKRWEHVLQYPFELIVRGIFKYQLPLSSRTMTTPISASAQVVPEVSVSGLRTLRVVSMKRLEREERDEVID